MRGERLAPALLGAAMLVSLGVCLYLGRDTIFSSDELAWLAESPDLGFRDLLDPYQGHLILLPRLLYKLLLDGNGGGYLVFRLLSLAAVYLTVGLLFIWARRRVGGWLALAPCLVLLFFGSDSAHILQGNGFTVMLAMACGLVAMLALDRSSRRGDLLACLALCVGAITYTVALPFILGAAVLVLASKNRWRRCWVFLVPAAAYAAWRLWASTTGADLSSGEISLENALLLPDWAFQATGAALAALTGLGFSFGEEGRGETAVVGPALALGLLCLLFWRYRRGPVGTTFAAVLLIGFGMFGLQVLSWIPGLRTPDAARYLFPGAIVVLLVIFEAARGRTFSPRAVIAVGCICLAGLGANLILLRDNAAIYRERAVDVKVQIAASTLLAADPAYRPGPGAVPLERLVETYSPVITRIGPAATRYRVGFDPTGLRVLSPGVRGDLDALLVAASAPTLRPLTGKVAPAGCVSAAREGDGYAAELPAGGGAVFSNAGGNVSIGRFGDGFSATVGTLTAGQSALLEVPDDGDPTPWRVSSAANFKVCDRER